MCMWVGVKCGACGWATVQLSLRCMAWVSHLGTVWCGHKHVFSVSYPDSSSAAREGQNEAAFGDDGRTTQARPGDTTAAAFSGIGVLHSVKIKWGGAGNVYREGGKHLRGDCEGVTQGWSEPQCYFFKGCQVTK